MQGEQQEVYVVRLYRKDQEIFDCFKAPDFTACKKAWKELYEKWQLCHTEGKVFTLESPIVTAFEPGLISEIVLVPYRDVLPQVDSDNPYKNQMMQKGFSQSMSHVSSGYSDILDNGFS